MTEEQIKINDLVEDLQKNYSIEQIVLFRKNAEDMGINRANPFLKNGAKRHATLKEIIRLRTFKVEYKTNKKTGTAKIKIYDLENNQFFYLDYEYFQHGYKETAISHLQTRCKIDILGYSHGKTPNEYYLFSLNQDKTANRTGEDEF